jgi:hypothetical protein
VERETPLRNPIRGTFFGCCASVLIEKVSSAVVTKIENQPAFFNSHLVREGVFNTERAAEKSAIYGIIKTRFFEGKQVNSDAGLH